MTACTLAQVQMLRDPSAVACGLVFAKIFDETFGGRPQVPMGHAQHELLTQYSVKCSAPSLPVIEVIGTHDSHVLLDHAKGALLCFV